MDLILAWEERVCDQVVEDLNSREEETCRPVHVVRVDIQDNREEATWEPSSSVSSASIRHTEHMESDIDELMQGCEEKSGRVFLHLVCFY